MAAQQSSRDSEHESTVQETGIASIDTRKSFVLQNANEIFLLREKLNQIAVGMRHCSDNQVEHMEESSSEEDSSSNGIQRRRRPHGHFDTSLPVIERPFTPPSSPQPRDVLRKQLRKMCRQPRSPTSDENNVSDASDEPMDAMCVDAIEISPVDDEDKVGSHRRSIPTQVHNVSSYSVLSKCPEGFRKRKSVYEENLERDGDSSTRLKKGQVTVMSLACHGSVDQVMEAVGTGMCS